MTNTTKSQQLTFNTVLLTAGKTAPKIIRSFLPGIGDPTCPSGNTNFVNPETTRNFAVMTYPGECNISDIVYGSLYFYNPIIPAKQMEGS